jgi:hypothetical protein
MLLAAAVTVGCDDGTIDSCKLVCELAQAGDCADRDLAACKADCDFWYLDKSQDCWDAAQAWHACQLERTNICMADYECAALSQSSQTLCR